LLLSFHASVCIPPFSARQLLSFGSLEKKKTKDEPKLEDEHYHHHHHHHPSPTVCFRTTFRPTESRDTLRLHPSRKERLSLCTTLSDVLEWVDPRFGKKRKIRVRQYFSTTWWLSYHRQRRRTHRRCLQELHNARECDSLVRLLAKCGRGWV